MWTRKELKDKAKLELKQSYWLSFAVCAIVSVLTGGSSGGSSFSSGVSTMADSGGLGPAFWAVMGTVIFGVIVFGTLFGIFVVNPLVVGQKSFFVRAPYGNRSINNLFSAFSGGNYINTVKTMFLTGLYIFLFYLLLIVPGIIKSYQYRMVAYIISEDPTLTTHQAQEISTRMTHGHKMEMFVLDLSFIGWYILGGIAFGIGVLFVTPYVEATYAQLYFTLKFGNNQSGTQTI